MALLPYLLGDLSPSRVHNRVLGLDIADDVLGDIFDRPQVHLRRYIRPWRNLAAMCRDVGSTIKTDKDKFQVNLDVQHFDPDEISVKTADGHIIIEGKHEERKDEHGYVSRQFKRRYALPDGCTPETVESKLSSDGVLTVTAPKKSSGLRDERIVPITHTGPVRRKVHDEESKGDENEANGEAEAEIKSPQKKRRR